MPTWFVHGFKWPRKLIRVHVIINDLDDAAPEWLMAPATSAALTSSFQKLYPENMAHLPSLRFIEQYDPEDLTSKSQPYAYVCDQVHEVRLGVDIDDIRGRGVANEAWGALVDLRDKIAPGEKPGWFVVVNGDVDRIAPPSEALQALLQPSSSGSQTGPASGGSSVNAIAEEDDDGEEFPRRPEEARRNSKGFTSFLGIANKIKRSKSGKNLREPSDVRTIPVSSPPPMPSLPISSPPRPTLANTAARPMTGGKGKDVVR